MFMTLLAPQIIGMFFLMWNSVYLNGNLKCNWDWADWMYASEILLVKLVLYQIWATLTLEGFEEKPRHGLWVALLGKTLVSYSDSWALLIPVISVNSRRHLSTREMGGNCILTWETMSIMTIQIQQFSQIYWNFL